jgi:hypothetical protein
MKPTIPKGRVRQKVLQVMNLRPGHPKTEQMILDGVNDLCGRGSVSLQEVRDAIEFNHGEGFIRTAWNARDEVDEWFITPNGEAEERRQ